MAQRLKRLPGNRPRWQHHGSVIAKPLQHVRHVGLIQHGIGQGGGPGEGLIAPGRELTHQGTVGAGAHKEEVARCVGPGVDRVACRLESQKHLVTLLGGDRLLHLIHDQHQIGAGLIHQLGEGLSQSGAPVFP